MKPDPHADAADRVRWYDVALARWENEGGAGPSRPNASLSGRERKSTAPPLTNSELVQLQVRVIALENLIIALLAQACDRQQLDLVREMAVYISPRPGFTPHRLTRHAAAAMISLADRAGNLRISPPLAQLQVSPDPSALPTDPIPAPALASEGLKSRSSREASGRTPS